MRYFKFIISSFMTSRHSATFLSLIKSNKTTSIYKGPTTLDMKHAQMNKAQSILEKAPTRESAQKPESPTNACSKHCSGRCREFTPGQQELQTSALRTTKKRDAEDAEIQ